MGMADDRGVRWSPDGRLLAFPHPGLPGQREPGGFFVDVVGVEGGRYPALSALQARARPEQLAIATAPGSVWFDWSPSGRFLAFHDGLSDLRVYDFEVQGTASLGKGQNPLWSPDGAYLLVIAAGQAAGAAFVLSGVAPAARIDLGQVRDARWLPAQACENGNWSSER
jgi:dipeptidyl aminopeptidase/acylaminoacyl peptidase